MERSWMNRPVPLWLALSAVLVAAAAAAFAANVILPESYIIKETVTLPRPTKHEVTVDLIGVETWVTEINLRPSRFEDCETKDGVSYKCPVITVKFYLRSIPQGNSPIRVMVELLQRYRGTVAWGEAVIGSNEYQLGENSVELTMNLENPNKTWDELIYDWMKYIVVTIAATN